MHWNATIAPVSASAVAAARQPVAATDTVPPTPGRAVVAAALLFERLNQASKGFGHETVVVMPLCRVLVLASCLGRPTEVTLTVQP
mmetsp:Transcript_102320/g.203125  ORF Transcript_102320/g.203125 Transcript_102320/m.203125 type:complete len:86 (-) Transcript_102320:2435-2692(-)